MKTHDLRRYNRRDKRNLAIEMDMFCLFNKKYIETNKFENDIPVRGKIKNVCYFPSERGNMLILELENGTEYNLKVKYGKPIIPETVKVLTGEQQ